VDWLDPVFGAWPESLAVSDGGWGQRSGASSPLFSPAVPDGLPDDGDELGLVDGLPGDPWLPDGLDEPDGLELPGLPGLPGDPGLPFEPEGGADVGGCGRDELVSLVLAQPASASAPARASPISECCLRHIPEFSVNAMIGARPAAIRPNAIGSRRPGDGSTRPAGAR
jgi:hypothetical protein